MCQKRNEQPPTSRSQAPQTRPGAWVPTRCRIIGSGESSSRGSISRNRFLSTDLQSAFWKRFGKEPSFGFPMDLTNLQALLNDQKAGSGSELTSHQLAF